MTTITKPPSFMPFHGDFDDLFEDVATELKKFKGKNKDEGTVFFNARVSARAQQITTDLLFETVMISFCRLHDVKIASAGLNIMSDRGGHFSIALPLLENAVNATERFLILRFDGEVDEQFWKEPNVHKSEDPTSEIEEGVTGNLSEVLQKDLAEFARIMEQIEPNQVTTILPVTEYIKQGDFSKPTPMKKKYPDFYPMLEKRILRSVAPENIKSKSKLKM